MIARTASRDSLIGMIGGPIVWAVNFSLCYGIVALSCALGPPAGFWLGLEIIDWVLTAVTAVSVAIIAALGLLAWRRARQVRWNARPVGEDNPDRAYFMSITAATLCALSAIAVLYGLVPSFLMATCQ